MKPLEKWPTPFNAMMPRPNWTPGSPSSSSAAAGASPHSRARGGRPPWLRSGPRPSTARFRSRLQDQRDDPASRQHRPEAKALWLVDAEREFAAADPPHGSPGKDLFYEHVHMTFSGNYQLARMIFQQVAKVVDPRSQKTAEELAAPSESTCAERLAYTRRERTRNSARIHEMLQNPPFTGQLDHAGPRGRMGDTGTSPRSRPRARGTPSGRRHQPNRACKGAGR